MFQNMEWNVSECGMECKEFLLFSRENQLCILIRKNTVTDRFQLVLSNASWGAYKKFLYQMPKIEQKSCQVKYWNDNNPEMLFMIYIFELFMIQINL